MRYVFWILVIAFGLSAVPSAATEGPKIRVELPWARASIGTSGAAAVYFTIVNESKKAASLLGVKTPVAGRATLHRTVKIDEIMRMQSVRTLQVRAGGREVLEPGGFHVMLKDLKQPLMKGASFPIVLILADGHTIEVTVKVMGVGARGPDG